MSFLTRNEVIMVLGIGKDELDELIKIGMPVNDNGFDLISVVPWYVRVLKDSNELKGKFIGRKELAELLGYKNEKYINELEGTYGLPKEGYNQYDIKRVLEWYIGYKNKQFEKQLSEMKGETPQDLLARRSAELKELQIREKNAGLVVKELVKEMWFDELNVIISNMDGFCAAMAPVLKGENDEGRVYELLEKGMNELKERIMVSGKAVERLG